MTNRRRWWLRGAIAVCLVGGALAWFGWRAAVRRAAIDAILKFDAAVYAQYGEYKYSPPLMIHPTGGLVIPPMRSPTSAIRESDVGDFDFNTSELKPTLQFPGVELSEEYERELSEESKQYENTLTLIIGGGQRAIGYFIIDDPPRFIAWAVPILGDDIGAHVTQIEIFDEQFSDTDIDILLAFPEVRELDLSGTSITDEGLTKLAASLNQLVQLDVSATKLTGRSTRLLANCQELRELDIRETADSEAAAEELRKQLPKCLIFD